MKIYKFFVGMSLLCGLSSCGDWLDIEPTDTTTETDLFATGDGYRVALNGIYEQMAETSLYGQELNWGFVEVLAQTYDSYEFGYAEAYKKAATYAYSDERVKPVISSIWSQAYNCVANCNNIIQRISEDTPGKFAQGQDEIDVIKGEALAMRAYLHFDLLRLFAPSMAVDDGKSYIPYVREYPCTFQAYSSNQEILEFVIEDLKEAKRLLEDYETTNIDYLTTSNRMENNKAPEDLFFAYRGYRVNYFAVCALLARVYNYAGRHQEAFNETTTVIEAYSSESQTNCFMPSNSASNGNTKLYDDIIFCLSNQQLWENYKSYYAASNNLVLSMWDLNELFDDEYDVRRALVQRNDYKYYCMKNVETAGTKAEFCKDMLPMIRLGEMYFIRAEYYNSKGESDLALDELETLREGYLCNIPLEGDVQTEIINEVKREYMCEGQLFFYYKKYNDTSFSWDVKAESFILPLPDNEEL